MKSFLVGVNGGVGSAGINNFLPFVYNSNNNWSNAVNAIFEQPLPHAVTLDLLRVQVATAPGTGNNIVYTVLKNGVATAITCTISGTATSAQDLTHTASFAAGDLITLQVTPSASATLPGTLRWTARQDATGLTAILGTANTTSLGQFAPMGYNTITQTTGDAGIIVPCGGTISNLYVINTASGTTWTVYKNGVAQTLTVAMAAATGNDTTHSFTVAAGDRISIASSVAGHAGSWGVSFAPTTDGQSFIGHINSTNTPTAATQYTEPLGPGTATWNSTESAVQVMLQACTLVGIYSQTSVSPGVSPKQYTFTARQNAANTAVSVVITDASATPNDGSSGREGGTVGQSVTVADDDLISISCTPSGTPSGLHSYHGLLLSVATGGGGGGTPTNLFFFA